MIGSLIRRVFGRGGSRRAQDGIEVTLDAEGRVVSASRSFERLLGYSPHEELRLSIADIVHPEDISAARELLRDGDATGIVLRVRDVAGGWHAAVARAASAA
jgi:PAS domain-containing protein